MLQQSDIQELSKKLEESKTVYVMIGADPTLDMVASSIVLAESIKLTGKIVHLLCPTKMIVEFSSLYKIDSVRDTIGNKDLIISLPYEKNQVEKVSYTISEDGSRFNLIISPSATQEPLNTEGVQFSYSGAQADLVICMGTESTEDLGQLYEQERSFFDSTYTVVINYKETRMLSRQEILIGKYSSFSEGVYALLHRLGTTIPAELSSNLLAGIEHETKMYTTPETSAETFQTVAELLRLGGKRTPVATPATNPEQSANGWFQQRTAPSYQSPAQQVSTSDFAALLKKSSSPVTTKELPVDEEPEVFEGELVSEQSDDQSEESRVEGVIEDLTSTQTQQLYNPAVAMNVSRGRKAAAAKKLKQETGSTGSVQPQQPGSFSPGRQ